MLAALETLVEHSLVRVDALGAGLRYRVLETVRQYALERLDDAGERALLRDRHRDALLALAERQRRAALTPRQPEVFAALDPEAANLAAALDHAVETDPDKALRLCLALDFWYRARARFREADDAPSHARSRRPTRHPCCRRARSPRGRGSSAAAATSRARTSSRPTPRSAPRPAATGRDRHHAAGARQPPASSLDPVAALELLHRCRERAGGDEYILGRTEALLRGVAWFQQDEQACLRGLRRAAAAARAAR